MEVRKATYIDRSETIEISMPPGRGDTDPLEAAQHRFIVSNWESFAAAAFEGFQRFGIGAVVVEEGAAQPSRVPHPFTAHQVWYATGFDAWMQQPFFAEAAAWLQELFETYDPREACVFIFLREDEHPRPYLVEASLKPPQALARLRALLN